PKGGLRAQPLSFAEAIQVETPSDEDNLAGVRRSMSEVMSCPVIEAGAIMPDACPVGGAMSIPVGGAVVTEGAILPGAHGSDICCSLYATFFQSDKEPSALMDELLGATRFGPGMRPSEDRVHHPVVDEPVWENRFLSGLQDHARGHMADQGDGNHFAFLGQVAWGEVEFQALEQAGHVELAESLRQGSQSGGDPLYAVVTHHGSRGLGAHVYKRGLQAAVKQTAKERSGIPDLASWLRVDTPEGESYWEALQYVKRWTWANHWSIHQRFLKATGSKRLQEVGNEHNFVWKRGSRFFHGKGATPAWPDEEGRKRLGLIPLNMSAPILLVLGNDQEDYLSFAPHGAGRNVSRRALIRSYQTEDGRIDSQAMEDLLSKATDGLDVRWYLGRYDFSEGPLAYKPQEQVQRQISQFDLADVVGGIHPLGSIMAGRRVGDEEDEWTPKKKRQIEHRNERRKERQKLRQTLHSDQD
ncbi:MAG: RtcB family protein, partial [Verrucomicrobiota bacterium]